MGRLLQARDPETNEPMSDSQLVDNLLTFLGAGHETTAKALTWSLYLLARAPEWQDKIASEVADVCGQAPVDAQHLDSLEITRAVFKEAMRLYPPAPLMNRMLTEPVILGGHDLPAGTMMVIPVYAIHRHRRLWQDPTASILRASSRTPRPSTLGPNSCLSASDHAPASACRLP